MLFFKGRPTEYVNGPYFYIKPNLGWNDYSFVTLFRAVYVNASGQEIFLGELKIGFTGQVEEEYTANYIPESFPGLGSRFFSLGQSYEYYEALKKNLSPSDVSTYLRALRDVVYDEKIFEFVFREASFVSSLTRFVSLSSIKGQYKNLLSSYSAHQGYGLVFSEQDSGKVIDFSVLPDSRPPTNIHILIGRNGVGKSHVLRKIANSIDKNDGVVFKRDGTPVNAEDFGLLLYFSLGVFGNPLKEVEFNDSKIDKYRTKKNYIGIYDKTTQGLKDIAGAMAVEFADSLKNCLLGSEVKREQWFRAVRSLETDCNFKELNLPLRFETTVEQILIASASELFVSLSSGHAAVLYYITSIVELVEDRTICLFDEPENHLHPPLLSTFIRVLSELLSIKNGLAIIATHSPVILQEVPRSCVWKVSRDGSGMGFVRPCIETFGESVGEITTEVFNLDLRNSGFYKLLEEDAKRFNDYGELLEAYQGAIGLEGRAVVSSSMRRGRFHG